MVTTPLPLQGWIRGQWRFPPTAGSAGWECSNSLFINIIDNRQLVAKAGLLNAI